MSTKLAVLGAGSQLGREVLSCLEERDFPVEDVIAVASRKDIGAEVSYGDRTLKMRDVEGVDWSRISICLATGGMELSRKWVRPIAEAGALVIDSSSAFRRDPTVPLIVADVNASVLAAGPTGRIIAIPGPVAAQLAIALKPIHDAAGIERAVIATYQSVSSGGREAMDELWVQTKGVYVNQAPEPRVFAKQIAFNVIPQIGDVRPDGATDEEASIVFELQKVLDPDILAVATCVQTPVFVGHGAAVHLELASHLPAGDARALLRESPGLMVVDKHNEEGVVTPVETVGEWAVFISRIRADTSVDHGLSLWVVADALRKGSALNLVMTAEIALSRGLLAR
ncbi:aspartate-semialdehyde dehydrogenase [bacterium]|nr:aspartate-semialdehyde dehydrogenase [bacterium]